MRALLDFIFIFIVVFSVERRVRSSQAMQYLDLLYSK